MILRLLFAVRGWLAARVLASPRASRRLKERAKNPPWMHRYEELYGDEE